MSFHIVEQANAHLNRSELAVPGSKPELFEKAASSSVDVIFLDLEDSVAPASSSAEQYETPPHVDSEARVDPSDAVRT